MTFETIVQTFIRLTISPHEKELTSLIHLQVAAIRTVEFKLYSIFQTELVLKPLLNQIAVKNVIELRQRTNI